MKRAIKLLCIAVAIPLLFLFSCVTLDQIPHSRATPPKSVTNISTCLAWLKNPMGAYRVTTAKSVYYLITGPAGCCLPSGTSAYAFDSAGKFIGWTPDDGDIHTPVEVFAPDSKDEKISIDELKKIFKL